MCGCWIILCHCYSLITVIWLSKLYWYQMFLGCSFQLTGHAFHLQMTQHFTCYFLPDHILKFPNASFFFSFYCSCFPSVANTIQSWCEVDRLAVAAKGGRCQVPSSFPCQSWSPRPVSPFLMGPTVLAQAGLRASHPQLEGPTFVLPQPTTRLSNRVWNGDLSPESLCASRRPHRVLLGFTQQSRSSIFSTQTGKSTQKRAKMNDLPDSSHAVLPKAISHLIPRSHNDTHGLPLPLPF